MPQVHWICPMCTRYGAPDRYGHSVLRFDSIRFLGFKKIQILENYNWNMHPGEVGQKIQFQFFRFSFGSNRTDRSLAKKTTQFYSLAKVRRWPDGGLRLGMDCFEGVVCLYTLDLGRLYWAMLKILLVDLLGLYYISVLWLIRFLRSRNEITLVISVFKTWNQNY